MLKIFCLEKDQNYFSLLAAGKAPLTVNQCSETDTSTVDHVYSVWYASMAQI